MFFCKQSIQKLRPFEHKLATRDLERTARRARCMSMSAGVHRSTLPMMRLSCESNFDTVKCTPHLTQRSPLLLLLLAVCASLVCVQLCIFVCVCSMLVRACCVRSGLPTQRL